MKVVLNETQYKIYKNFLHENLTDEGRALPKRAANIIKAKTDDVLQHLYGDKYGKKDEKNSETYGVCVTYDGDIATGLFSLGNAKLSDDTMIINFTSALGCPSAQVCPVSQKACYAVAGENRLPATRRKNLMVQNIWFEAMKKASKNDKTPIDKIFSIAELYVRTLNEKINGKYRYKKPLKFVRFNEAGDFPSQDVLEGAARFAAFAKEFGIMCMAYTSRKHLDFSKIAEGTDLPIDKLIKINISREDIKVSSDTTKQRFLATPMNFKELLSNNDKVESISDSEANTLKCLGTEKSENGNGINSIPILSYGKWTGGEGWYYVCPCSFWKYNKDKAESLFYQKIGLTDEDSSLNPALRKTLRSQLTIPEQKKLNSILNKIKSPCGVECAVCHDMEGGITPDGKKRIKEYTVLTATHGATASNYDPDYAEKMRTGQDEKAMWHNNAENPRGLETKYNDNKKAYRTKKRELLNNTQNID